MFVLTTTIDITPTGVLSYNKNANNLFERNQQRNWQTFTQILQLRTQITVFRGPERTDSSPALWAVLFGTETQDVWLRGQDPVGELVTDAQGVPVISGLLETLPANPSCIVTQGANANTWFYTQSSWSQAHPDHTVSNWIKNPQAS
jgi:hypothetical protein